MEYVRYMKVCRRYEKQEERANKEKFPEITRFAIAQERKEEKVNKERAQEILLSGIIVQNQSMGRKKEVKVQRDDDSTDKYGDYFGKIFF